KTDLGRRAWQRPAHPIMAVRKFFHARLGVLSREVLPHRARTGRRGIVLGVPREGGRPLDGAPVVKDFRDVSYLFRAQLLRATQDEIVVLATFETDSEPTNPANQPRSDCRQVADIILAAQQVRIEVWLEIRVE